MSEAVPVAEPNLPAVPEPVRPPDFHPDMTPEELERQLQVNIVDMSHGVKTAAQDHAAEYINRHASEGGNIATRLLRRVWHGNLARDYYNIREQQRGVNKIAETGNIHALYDGTDEDHARTAADVVERVSLGHLHQGEVRQSIGEINGGDDLESGLRDLVRSYASDPEMTREALAEARTRLLKEFGKGKHADDRNKGLLFADNVLEVADNARTALAHGLGLDRIDAALGVQHTEASMGARTQLRLSAAEKMADKLYQTKLGSMVNETTFALVASVPFIAGKIVTRKAVTAAAGAVTIGAGSAVIAGVRESLHIKQDRQTHMREMATGGGEALAHAGKRRNQLEETRYNTFHVDEVLSDLQHASETAASGKDGLTEAVDLLAFARTLVSQSDERSIDLLQFSSRTTVESERLKVDIKIAEARAAVEAALAGTADDVKTELAMDGKDVGAILDERCSLMLGEINDDISARDQAFRKLQHKQVLKAAAIGFVTSEVIGTGIQEVKAALSDSLQGVFENGDGESRRTLLASLLHRGGQGGETPSTGNGSVVTIGEHAKVDVPSGYHLVKQDGKWELFDSSNKVVDGNVTFDHGHLSEASQQALQDHGFGIHEDNPLVHDADTKHFTDVQRTPAEYINHHKGDFTQVHRELWYDNDTARYDDNELGMWWGGEQGTGIDADGNYVFSVAHMNSDGSFNGNLSADYRQLIQEGKLQVALSVNDGTQDHVIMVHVNQHGEAIINKDSFAGRSLFAHADGHAEFIGKYAETVQLTDKHDGVQGVRMLATVVGQDRVGSITDHVPHIVHHSHHEVISTLTPPVEHPAAGPIEAPGAIPLRVRGGLEYPSVEGGYGYGYGYNQNPDYWKRWDRERSPRLRSNPDADLETGEELAWYRREQTKVRGKDYLAEIDGYIDADPTLSAIDDTTKAIVCIPVAAANESDNIYRTLRLFAEQSDGEAQDESVILLNLNWKYDLEQNTESMAKIQKTLSEVERAKADFPHLKIASFNKVWSPELLAERGNKLYGEVIKVLYDTAALAMDRAVTAGRRQSATEALLITNDADTLGLSRNYLRNYIQALDRNPTADVFSATIRRGTAAYRDFPGYGVASDFYAMLNMMMQRQQKAGNGGFTTEGPNSGIRMSMYAAIGGVEDRIGAGADAVLGQRVAAARRTGPNATFWQRLRSGQPSEGGSDRVIGHYVGGAQLDTLPDRLLGAYRQGKWIARGWDNFDGEDGYEGREVSMQAGDLQHENPATDMDAIAERIEASVEGFASNWYRDPAVVSSALALTFGTNTDDEQLYESSWDWSGAGRFAFKFTERGKQVLQNRLMRDRRGRFDAFGSRLARQLYNEVSNGAAKRPVNAEPRFIS